MREKKSWIIIVGICLAIGIVYAISISFPEEQARFILIGVAVSFAVLWMVFKMVTMYRLSKKVSAPVAFLYEEKNPAKYIEAMEQVLSQVSNRQQKDLISINVSAAQIYDGEYARALEIMEKISVNAQPISNQVLFYTNQLMAYFLNDNSQEVNTVFEKQKELLEKYQNTAGISNNLAVVFAMQEICADESEKAYERLCQLEPEKVSAILIDIVDYTKYICLKNLKREEERLAIWDTMSGRRLVPAVEKKMQKEKR